MSANGEYVIVHNGIIENFKELKSELLENGYNFTSETDSEVVAHLLEHIKEKDFLKAVYK